MTFLHHTLTEPLPPTARGAVIAIGNFDGVHRGHQVVLERAQMKARTASAPCYALSFEPHPRTLFKPESPVFRLTPERDKVRVLSALGLDGLLTLPFTRELAGTDAADFVDRHLVGAAGAAHIVSGFNFHFGKNRQGSPEFLQKAGSEKGFGVTIVNAEADAGDEPISSSRVRRALGAGNTALAGELLGYRWNVSGVVVKGQQLGRTLGYPTANIALAENCRLAHGIYAVRLRRADGTLHDGVASYGRRPTFDNGAPVLETYVFDFSNDLYDEVIEISLFHYLRGEEKFDSADALVAQMKRDEAEARSHLATVTPLSKLDATLNFQEGEAARS